MRRPLDSVLAKQDKEALLSIATPAQNEGRRGRPLALSDAELFYRRDQLQGIFEAVWPMIGWNLQRARKPIYIAYALRPTSEFKQPTLELLLLDSSAKARPDEIRPLQQECKKLYRELSEVENRLRTTNAKVTEAHVAFEQAYNQFAVARDGHAKARKKKQKKKAKALLKEREKASRLCDSVSAELKRREETLKQCYAEERKITKEIAESQGWFAQAELLNSC